MRSPISAGTSLARPARILLIAARHNRRPGKLALNAGLAADPRKILSPVPDRSSDEHRDPVLSTYLPGPCLFGSILKVPVHRCRPLNIRRETAIRLSRIQARLPSAAGQAASAPRAVDTLCSRGRGRVVESPLVSPFAGGTFLGPPGPVRGRSAARNRRREPRSRRRDLPGLATPARLSSPVLHMRPAFVPEGGRAARPSPPGALRAALTTRPSLPRVLGLPS
jgi:hypothetical protein